MLGELWLLITLNLPAALFMLAGIGLLIAEILMPGFGVAGCMGLICLIVGVVLKAETVLEGLVMGLFIMLISGAAMAVSLRSFAKGKLSRSPLILMDSTTTKEGFVAANDFSAYMNHEGVVLTALRPAGAAEINGKKLDVVSDGDFIMPNERVKVTEVSGSRIVVRRVGKK